MVSRIVMMFKAFKANFLEIKAFGIEQQNEVDHALV